MGRLKRFVGVRFSEEDYVYLVDRAAVLNTDVSEVIRRIIHTFRFLTEQPLMFLIRPYSDLEKEFGEEGILLLSPEAQEAAKKLLDQRKELNKNAEKEAR